MSVLQSYCFIAVSEFAVHDFPSSQSEEIFGEVSQSEEASVCASLKTPAGRSVPYVTS